MPNIDTKQTIGWVKGALYVLAITGTLIIAIFASNLAKINNIDSAFAQQKATIMIQVQRVDDRGANERFKTDATGIGFFGSTPTGQYQHIPNANPLSLSNTAATLNVLLTALELYGLLATS